MPVAFIFDKSVFDLIPLASKAKIIEELKTEKCNASASSELLEHRYEEMIISLFNRTLMKDYYRNKQ